MDKKAANSIEELGSFAEALLDATDDAAFLIDTSGTILAANDELARRLEQNKQDLIGQDIYSLLPPEVAARRRKWVDQVVRSGKSLSEEDQRGDRLLRNIVYPVFDDSGDVIAVAVYGRDITERRKSEEQVTLLGRMLDDAPAAVTVHDTDGNFLFSNRQNMLLHGYDKEEEFLKINLHQLDVPDSEALVSQRMRKTTEEGKARFEVAHYRKDGSKFPLEVTAKKINWHGRPAVLSIAVDITERKRAERLLRESENRFQRILALIPDMISIHDPEMNILYSNWNGFGAIPEDRRKLNTKCYRTYRGFDRICPDCRAVTVLKTGEAFSRDVQLPDGRWYDVRILPLLDETGEVEAFVEWVREITDRKHAEERIRSAHDLSRSIIEHGPAGITIVNREGVVESANRLAQEILGLSQGEIQGRTYRDLKWKITSIDGSEFPDRKLPFRRVLDTGEAVHNVQHAIERPSGERRLLSINAAPLKNQEGFTERVVCVIRDITERKRAEKELRESEERFRYLLNDLPFMSVQGYRADGTTVYWNRGSEILYGYTAEEALGKNLLDLIIPPEMKEDIKQAVREMAETGIPLPASELQLMRKDGSLVTVFSSHMILERPEHPTELFCLDLDLTEIKKAEQERKRLREQLAHAQKMESVGRLAGGVAHDFNNVIMGIMGYADLCRDTIAEDHQAQDLLDEITRQAERSAKLTRQLLAFARKQTVAPRVTDINDDVSRMLKMLLRLIGEDIDLSWEPGADLWPVRIDPSQVDQILANLCVNARDAIRGVGRITIESENVSLDGDYCAENAEARPGDYIMLAVSDDGCGMEPETLENIFEPFFTTKNVGEGTGLGLATVYGIVKQNGGFVNVYSEPGEGSTFKVYLPRFQGRETRKRPAEEKSMGLGGTETILLVEDEGPIRTTMKIFLEDFGYTVLSAEEPETALIIAAEHSGEIDLLVTDVVMPGMNGRDLAEKLQAEFESLKVLYMSGYTADVIAHRGILDEGMHFMSKPVRRHELARKVREVLEQ